MRQATDKNVESWSANSKPVISPPACIDLHCQREDNPNQVSEMKTEPSWNTNAVGPVEAMNCYFIAATICIGCE